MYFTVQECRTGDLVHVLWAQQDESRTSNGRKSEAEVNSLINKNKKDKWSEDWNLSDLPGLWRDVYCIHETWVVIWPV